MDPTEAMPQDTPDDWPEPVEIVNPDGASDIVLLCEHASNHIPAAYAGLGLTPDDLSRHIAWDIGAAEVTRRLSALLDAPAFLGTTSRLLIDLNRPLDAPSSIVTRSEDTDIPGNVDLDRLERDHRAKRIFRPFHTAVSRHLDRRQHEGRFVRLVSIHSFTPVFKGVSRPWTGGVLFDRAEAFGRSVIAHLRQAGLHVEANVPYTSDRAEDFAVPIHGDDRGIPAILIEIRNDLIRDGVDATNWGVELWAARLNAALRQGSGIAQDRDNPL